jgi:hypothetical protein
MACETPNTGEIVILTINVTTFIISHYNVTYSSTLPPATHTTPPTQTLTVETHLGKKNPDIAYPDCLALNSNNEYILTVYVSVT